MLSSLQNFLPQVLQRDHPQQRVASPETSSDDEHEVQTPAEETGPKRRPTKGSNETFIIVRPPPSKSNHPLNLQVQLVPPSSKTDRSRRASTDEQGILTRSNSRSSQSQQSIYSSYSSAASVNSVGSTASNATNRRMIIPLYNLQAHNVMTNVIVDAGTDAKIAKFYKRGLEIIGLAVLEPTEVHGQGGQPQVDLGGASLAPTISHTSTGRTPEASPAASRISLSSSGHASTAHSAEPIHGHVQTPSQDAKSGPKKLFGRFFKKKEPSTGSATPSPMSTPTRRDRSPSQTNVTTAANLTTPKAPSKRNSLLVPVIGHTQAPSTGTTAATGEVPVFLLPAVLGIQPVLSGPTYPPQGKSAGYTWTVRRWLKGTPESVFGNVFDSAIRSGGGKEGKSGPGAMVELRFEWTRGTRKDRKRKDAAGPQEGKLSAAPSTTSLSAAAADPTKGTASAPGSRIRQSRRSLDAAQNVPTDSPTRADSRSMKSTDDGHSLSRHSRHDNDDDDGEESDPEDSETPWTCTLIAHSVNAIDVVGQEPVRAKVATLSPTPHHPKVVAALKIPFPLPDVDVDGAALRPRVITPAGVARPMPESHDSSGSAGGGGGGGAHAGGSGRRGREMGLVLTAEEIKDVVSATGMWLVCRESIGGVGRVNRKGDGWKIRG